MLADVGYWQMICWKPVQNFPSQIWPELIRAGMSKTHTTATLTLWIGGSESNRQSHFSPPSLPIQS